jgi:hypothetical protein
VHWRHIAIARMKPFLVVIPDVIPDVISHKGMDCRFDVFWPSGINVLANGFLISNNILCNRGLRIVKT